jgi:hypothetical protein
MSDVTKLEPPLELVMQCTQCGCQTFYLHADGSTECGHCHGTEAAGAMGWRPQGEFPDPLTPTPLPKHAPPVRRLLQMGTSEAARRTVSKRIMEDDVVGACVVHRNGSMNMWHEDHLQTKAQTKWWKRKMREWLEAMTPFPQKSTGKG